MSFNRPSAGQIVDQLASDINSRVAGVDANLRRSNLGIIAKVFGLSINLLYGYVDVLAKQILPDTATTSWLERHAGLHSVYRLPSSISVGTATITGAPGATLPSGTEIVRSDSVLFVTTADVTIPQGGSIAVAVESLDAGANTNTFANTSLQLTYPVTGIDTSCKAGAAGITGGADIESDDSLRTRLLYKLKNPPHGGSKSDWLQWTLAIPGITRAWVSPGEFGLGTVVIRFVRDNDLNLLPDQNEIDIAREALEANRPITADLFVLAPVAKPIDFTVSVNPNTQSVKDAVVDQLKDLIAAEAEPGSTLPLSHIRAAISAAAGEYDYLLMSPTADIVADSDELITLGAVSFA